MKQRGPLPVAEVAEILQQAARELNAAHKLSILHRDLKPDNIFLATNVEDLGELSYCVKLVDFGIAKMVQEKTEPTASYAMGGPTQEGAVVGTPNFMSPEQLTVGGGRQRRGRRDHGPDAVVPLLDEVGIRGSVGR